MQRKTPKLLDDIRDAIAFIRQATQDATAGSVVSRHPRARSVTMV